jgi:hypothetical protein
VAEVAAHWVEMNLVPEVYLVNLMPLVLLVYPTHSILV